jgi:hypothetical protein
MKNIRPMGWVIIIFNAYYLYAFSKGVVDLSAEGGGDTAVGIYAFFSLIIWAVLNIILYVLFRVTAKKRRECPACGVKVPVGKTICPKCQFDFAKAAGSTS